VVRIIYECEEETRNEGTQYILKWKNYNNGTCREHWNTSGKLKERSHSADLGVDGFLTSNVIPEA
jgi:hypothetical protein